MNKKQRPLPKWIDENLPPELATSSLFKFNVKLQATEDDGQGGRRRREITVDLLPDLDIDYEQIVDQMMDVPSTYAFWSAVYSEVKLGVAIAERKLKARRAEATKAVGDEFQKGGLKPPSAEVIKTIVEADELLNKAELAFQFVQMQAGKLYHMLEALKMKAELARSLLSLKKQDRDNT